MLVLMLALAAEPAAPPDVATEVRAVVAAAGGEKAWRATPCRLEKGRLTTPKNAGALFRAVAWPARLQVEVRYATNPTERRVLNALGESELSARAIGQLVQVADAVAYMEELVRKLESYGIELVEPGTPDGGEPTYRLRARAS